MRIIFSFSRLVSRYVFRFLSTGILWCASLNRSIEKRLEITLSDYSSCKSNWSIEKHDNDHVKGAKKLSINYVVQMFCFDETPFAVHFILRQSFLPFSLSSRWRFDVDRKSFFGCLFLFVSFKNSFVRIRSKRRKTKFVQCVARNRHRLTFDVTVHVSGAIRQSTHETNFMANHSADKFSPSFRSHLIDDDHRN